MPVSRHVSQISNCGSWRRANTAAVSGHRRVGDDAGLKVIDFALFLDHHSLAAVVTELARRRWKTKSWKSQSGTAHAGRDFAQKSLHRLLTNAVYAGKVEHKGAMYASERRIGTRRGSVLDINAIGSVADC